MRRAMQLLIAFIPAMTSAQVYYPLHVGDSWGYEDNSSVYCEGSSLIVYIPSDTLLNGKHYYRILSGFPLPGPFVRAESTLVLEYDTSSNQEHIAFDFAAKPGDTVSVRGNDAVVTVALGNLTFQVGNTYVTVHDSIGVTSWRELSGIRCNMHLTGATINGKQVSTDISPNGGMLPSQPYLEPCYPNPFNPSTSIRLYIPHGALVSVGIFDGLGRSVEKLSDGLLSPGWHTFVWEAKNQASGSYYCRALAGYLVLTQRLLLLR
jgi:hypothetical protein